MKVRQDAWTDEDDLLLAETVLRHVREGSTQLNAFEEVGDKLNRTSAACGFRWNAVVRHRYEKALQLAKKQRKQRNRILGKDEGGKKKLLYTPPVPAIDEIEELEVISQSAELDNVYQVMTADTEFADFIEVPMNTQPVVTQQVAAPMYRTSSGMTMEAVITFLQSIDSNNLHHDALKSENERLKRENAELRKKYHEMASKVQDLEQDTVTIQEDYETLMKIMNRARKLVLFEEEERPATKFKMDRNGNLEKVAE
ncbi:MULTISPECIES: RsfA family transcriptional regulator [unclassified Bacillus (in: firmicutes)]|uniref:RsfA family transcriptional regulator n=1 Tax=unclassified Bacillus (in: firmicutes) TaxID=185979 RepID=UPI0008DFA2A0|nr:MULTISPECIES: RsfA family transcriptional regulator [unclassified Bacillus (in: firmicutes)]SFB03348.1 prespore-specific regulator [Bacillus sp. UNCCL13]SFQ88831.1 prespore-specific regulator [Bacillus sp. cl95]